jgi:hypothetical protein
MQVELNEISCPMDLAKMIKRVCRVQARASEDIVSTGQRTTGSTNLLPSEFMSLILSHGVGHCR